MTDDIHLTREDDHATSDAAAAKIEKNISRTMRRVHMVHKAALPRGLADFELRKAMVAAGFHPAAESTYRKRRTDLTALGYIIKTDEKRRNDSGNDETVWIINPDMPDLPPE